tara:strand:+ start:30333 stop:30884 length:552 start_codon:yes stop_codon:yes gene_type:complete
MYFKNHIMKTVSLLIVFFSLTFSLYAQECSEDFKQIEGLWENLSLENALNDPESITSGFDSVKGSLTKSLGGLSFKSNTPKLLSTKGKPKNGTIKKNKKKTYVTYMAPKETMEIVIQSAENLAGLEVVICSHTKTNMTENLDSYTLAAGDSSKSFVLENVKGKVLSISLKNGGEKAQFSIAAK